MRNAATLIQSHMRLWGKWLFSMVAVALGTGAIYLLLFMGDAYRQEIARRFYSQGMDLFSIIKKNQAEITGPAQIRDLDYSVAEYLKKDPRYVTHAAMEYFYPMDVRFDNETINIPTIGIRGDFAEVHNLSLSKGRFLSYLDAGKYHCVIGHGLAQRLGLTSAGSLTDKKITVLDRVFHIIGILDPVSSPTAEYRLDEALLLPFDTILPFLNAQKMTKMTLRVNPYQDVTTVERYIKTSLENYLGDISIYEITNQRIFLDVLQKQLFLWSRIVGICGFCFFVFGIWLLSGIFILHYAPQFSPRDRSAIVLESVLLGFVYGIAVTAAGMLAGHIFAFLLCQANGWPMVLSSTAAGFLAATVPFFILFFSLLGWGLSSSMSSKK